MSDLQGQVSDTQSQLQGAQNTVQLQGTEIGNLRQCLNGVASSLSDLASGFLQTALDDLNSVDAVCQEAHSGLG